MRIIGEIKAICPKDKNHNKFTTVVHVAQDWLVDAEGNFLDAVNSCTDIVAHPDKDNIWTCAECGAEAIFVNRI